MPQGQSVAVVGAGLAGLAAALELVRAGHVVTVFEAQAWPGGRVRTIRGALPEGALAEAGGIYIPDNHILTHAYIDRFLLGSRLTPLPNRARNLYRIRGQTVDDSAAPRLRWPVQLPAAEINLCRQELLANYLRRGFEVIGDPRKPDWSPEPFRDLDDISFAEWLRQQGATEGGVALMRLGYLDLWGDGIHTASALAMLHALALEEGRGGDSVLEGGNDQLPRAMAMALGDRIHYRSPVHKIEQTAQHVDLSIRRGEGEQTVRVDRVVIAVPCSTLKRIRIEPPVSEAKRRLVDGLGSASISRVFLQMKERFWAPYDTAWTLNTDGPIMRCVDLGAGSEVQQRLLFTYVAGQNARRLADADPAERIRATLAELDEVLPGAARACQGSASFCWDEQEWIRGAYAWVRPGQLRAIWPALTTPEGRLHFAGEHTSIWAGWMQGALESGLRAAREIG